MDSAVTPTRNRGWRRAGARGIGGLSWWFVLAVASLLLVFPTGLSILYAPQTAVPNGLAYSGELMPMSYCGPRCAFNYTEIALTGHTDYLNVLFSIQFSWTRVPSPRMPSGPSHFVTGYISELGGENYTFNISCYASEPCSAWITPDLIAGVSLAPVSLDVSILVLASEIPGSPAYVGPALFGAGAIVLIACAAFLVVRFRHNRGQRTKA